MSDKDKDEQETWDLSKEKTPEENNVVIQGSNAELVKKQNKTAPVLLNNCVSAGMSEVLCKAN